MCQAEMFSGLGDYGDTDHALTKNIKKLKYKLSKLNQKGSGEITNLLHLAVCFFILVCILLVSTTVFLLFS